MRGGNGVALKDSVGARVEVGVDAQAEEVLVVCGGRGEWVSLDRLREE